MTVLRILLAALIGTVAASLVVVFLPEPVRLWVRPVLAALISGSLYLIWSARKAHREAMDAMHARVEERLSAIDEDLRLARTHPRQHAQALRLHFEAEKRSVQAQVASVSAGQLLPRLVPRPRPTLSWVPEVRRPEPVSATPPIRAITPRISTAP
ncbi:hypothetical protein [Deinococcus multiflagellatus]|uniref:Uncharacterized protein n=2 Tax=Deinococcus multiflagellatus TaxID=1656887 RepID=A0ABW1ZR73_9DEIO